MQPADKTPRYGFRTWSRHEEIVNAAVHGVGFLLGLSGIVAVAATWQAADAGRAFAFGVYAATLLAVYGVSTVSHAVRQPHAIRVMRRWDQGVIYLLIIGTYTPFAWAFLPPRYVGPFLGATWAAALLGFASKVVVRHRTKGSFSALSYLALGWVPAMLLLSVVPMHCLAWMAAGGISYTAGTWLLKMDQQVRYFHAAWHVCVILGSACHFYAVYAFVVLPAATGVG